MTSRMDLVSDVLIAIGALMIAVLHAGGYFAFEESMVWLTSYAVIMLVAIKINMSMK
jgi:hypothetical protein